MIVYKMYLKLMSKQLFTVLLYVMIFAGIVGLFIHFSTDEIFTGYQQKQVRIAFCSEDDSMLTIGIKEYLMKYCEFVPLTDEEEELRDALFYHQVDCVVTVPEKFYQKFGTKEERPVQIQSVLDNQEMDYVSKVLDHYLTNLRLLIEQGSTMQEAIKCMQVAQMRNPKVNVTNSQEELEQKEANLNLIFNLLAYILMACFGMIICNAMAQLRNPKMMARHMVAPISKLKVYLEVLLGNLSCGTLYFLIFLGVAILFGAGAEQMGKAVLYWMNAFIYALTMILLGNLLGMVLKNRTRINVSANLSALILAAISGVVVRQEFLGSSVLKIASFTPVYWFVLGNQKILETQGNTWDGIQNLLMVFAIQGMYLVVFFLVGMVMMKVEE